MCLFEWCIGKISDEQLQEAFGRDIEQLDSHLANMISILFTKNVQCFKADDSLKDTELFAEIHEQ